MAHRVSIIGSAGRGVDTGRFTARVLERATERALHQVEHVWGLRRQDVVLVARGAAGAEHVAVRLFALGGWAGLELVLAAEFNDAAGRFDEFRLTGQVYNDAHDVFAGLQGEDVHTLRELADALRHPQTTVDARHPGYPEPTSPVAATATHLLAMGFGAAAGTALRGDAGALWAATPLRRTRAYVDLTALLRQPVPVCCLARHLRDRARRLRLESTH